MPQLDTAGCVVAVGFAPHDQVVSTHLVETLMRRVYKGSRESYGYSFMFDKALCFPSYLCLRLIRGGIKVWFAPSPPRTPSEIVKVQLLGSNFELVQFHYQIIVIQRDHYGVSSGWSS